MIEEKPDKKLGSLEAKLSKKLDNLADFATGAIDTSSDEAGKQLVDHEHRLSMLEQKLCN